MAHVDPCVADINADLSCSMTTDPDMAIDSSLSPSVTMAMGDDADVSGHHGLRSSVVAGLRHAWGCQSMP